jgi:hypothetical protein
MIVENWRLVIDGSSTLMNYSRNREFGFPEPAERITIVHETTSHNFHMGTCKGKHGITAKRHLNTKVGITVCVELPVL